jgi:hypothetical protein
MKAERQIAWGILAVVATISGVAGILLAMPDSWRGRMKGTFSSVFTPGQSQAEEEREAMVDHAIEDSFPASDPPAWGSISKHSQ